MPELRAMIADSDVYIAEDLAAHLQMKFLVSICPDVEQFLPMLREFEPDVLIVDLCYFGCDAFEMIHMIRASGIPVEIITLSRIRNRHIEAAMCQIGGCQLITKPYRAEYVLACAYAAAMKSTKWDERLAAEYMLSSLGFNLGTNRMRYIVEGILLWYRANGDMAAKQLYPELAQICNNTVTAVEKAIRDGIHHAWSRGNRDLWALYFHGQTGSRQRCPSNEVFIARMAQCLWTKQRIRLHYKKAE